ncbi:MAG: nitrous oxide reductase accessory protein NosL [Burkholderiales bacterium]|nr:nitrous oxide reductase accessory protein NosL [Burkholderiales bacterium]
MTRLCSCTRRRFGAALGLGALVGLAACGRNEPQAQLAPIEIDRNTSCVLDGMTLADYPGPKAQIHYTGQAAPEFYCDTVEMFNTLLRPEQVRTVRAVFVQDMGRTDWAQPKGAWFDARSGFYVLGSKRHGSMGPTIASFSAEADATKFSAEHGGKVFRFDQIKPEMVDLSGGALHDSKM